MRTEEQKSANNLSNSLNYWKQQEPIYCDALFNQLNLKYKPTKDIWEWYDLSFVSGYTAFIGEVKIREDLPLHFFEKVGWEPFLEYKKYIRLVSKKYQFMAENKRDVQMMYLHNTADGYCQMYWLSSNEESFKWENRMLPDEDGGKKVLKKVTLLKGAIKTVKLWEEKPTA